MCNMFENCANLISVDLRNFDISNECDIENMFEGCNPNLIYCINNNLNNERLRNEIKKYNFKNNCSDICFNKDKKIIYNDRICSFKCPDIEKYDYKNVCYSSCPNGTYNLPNNTCINNDIIIDFGVYSTILFYSELSTDNIENYLNNSAYFNNITKSNNSMNIYNQSNCNDTNFTNITIINNSIISYNINTSYNNLSSVYDNNIFFNNSIGTYGTAINSNDKDYILLKIKNELIKSNLDFIDKDFKDIIIEDNNIKYHLTTSFNQINNIYNNISTINLGECETILKSYYNITSNIPLLIFKIDVYEKGLLIPIIEYEVYNIKTKKLLDLNLCKDIKIDINIPVKINEKNLFEYNPYSKYYNDICFPYSTEKSTDITLKDRRNRYIYDNMSLCENDCLYNGYNNDTKKVQCKCNIKIKFPLVSEIVINKDKLLNNFINLKNTINIIIIKCYYTLFKKEGIIKNLGNYIISIIIILTIIFCIIFRMKGYYKIKILVNYIIENKKVYDGNIKDSIKNKNIWSKIEKNKKIKNNYNGKQNNNKSNKGKMIKLKKERNKINKKIIRINNKINYMKTIEEIKDKTNERLKFKTNYHSSSNISINNNIINTNNINMQQNILIDKEAINNKYSEINDYELNSLVYNDALKIDKRTYIQYYFSLLKMKHIIIFTFYTNNDYNSKSIKIILLLFSFSLNLTVNALFFVDETMHTIYLDQGDFNFIYQIPQILYSTVITSLINTIIKYLSLSEKKILEIKKRKEFESESKIISHFVIKFTFFFILIYIFLILFWYYLSCFCAVYVNTQIHLIKDTLISFGFCLIYPFGLNLLPGIFRIPSLKKGGGKWAYNLSKFFQLL